MVLAFIGGADAEIGGRIDGSGDWGLYSLSCRIAAIVANTMKGFGGMLRSLRLGGTIGCRLPNPYGNMGSLESESIVIICSFGEATDEIVIVPLAIVPDSCVEWRTAGVLVRAGLLSVGERST